MKTVRERGTWRARIRLAAFFGTALVALGLIASGAWAVFQPVGATDNAYTGGSGGLTPTYAMDQGDRPTLSNGGADTHNVTSRQNGPDGHFLFSTPTIGGGQQATIDGTQYLTAGTYSFFCSLHPTEMQATLVVSSNGTPQPRPQSSIKLKSGSKLAKAIKKGIQVVMTPTTRIDGVTLTAKLGKSTIGKSTVSLAEGWNSPSVKLSKAGKRKLRGRDTAKVSVTADIPFGSPVSAKGTLR